MTFPNPICDGETLPGFPAGFCWGPTDINDPRNNNPRKDSTPPPPPPGLNLTNGSGNPDLPPPRPNIVFEGTEDEIILGNDDTANIVAIAILILRYHELRARVVTERRVADEDAQLALAYMEADIMREAAKRGFNAQVIAAAGQIATAVASMGVAGASASFTARGIRETSQANSLAEAQRNFDADYTEIQNTRNNAVGTPGGPEGSIEREYQHAQANLDSDYQRQQKEILAHPIDATYTQEQQTEDLSSLEQGYEISSQELKEKRHTAIMAAETAFGGAVINRLDAYGRELESLGVPSVDVIRITSTCRNSIEGNFTNIENNSSLTAARERLVTASENCDTANQALANLPANADEGAKTAAKDNVQRSTTEWQTARNNLTNVRAELEEDTANRNNQALATARTSLSNLQQTRQGSLHVSGSEWTSRGQLLTSLVQNGSAGFGAIFSSIQASENRESQFLNAEAKKVEANMQNRARLLTGDNEDANAIRQSIEATIQLIQRAWEQRNQVIHSITGAIA